MVWCRSLGDRELELRADPVGAGDQHGVPVAVKGKHKECAEAAGTGEDAVTRSPIRDPADARYEIVAKIDVDAGVAIAQAVAGYSVHRSRW